MYCSDQQREIVESEDLRVLVNGVAGSRKSDTLVKLCVKLLKRDLNVLILTLVGSVTAEIRDRLESALSITFGKIGNHFLYDFGGHSVEIANYDAMVHKQLQMCKDTLMTQTYGDCFEEKTMVLYEKHIVGGVLNSFFMINGNVADVIAMDEFQDLSPMKTRILTDIINQNPDMHAIACGDYLQTIFDHSIQPDDGHPMEIWKAELSPREFYLSKCFRCPLTHVRFANALMGPYYAKYSLPEMEAASKDADHKPVVMMCPPFSNNKLSNIIAIQVRQTLDAVLSLDMSVHPRDVAVIMNRTNGNPVFKQLEYELNELYARRFGLSNAVKVFETRGDGYSTSIDWGKAVDKTVLLSIHGDKGKGHKVVFFLGFTENSIPKATRLFTPKSLIDESLTNVAVTRSTRWLFVGVTRDSPSRYMRDISCQKCAVLSWDCGTWTESWHSVVCDAINNNAWTRELPHPAPLYTEGLYRKTAINAPDKFVLRVKDDVAHTYEHPKQLFGTYNWQGVEVRKFGNTCPPQPLSDEQIPVYGCMGEIIFMHLMGHVREFKALVSDDLALHLTDDQQLLNAVQDENLNTYILNDPTLMTFHGVLSRMDSPPEILTTSCCPMMVVPTIIGGAYIQNAIQLFLDTPTADVPPVIFWNMAIVYDMVYSPIRTPMIHALMDTFVYDLTPLVSNIVAFADLIADTPVLRVHKQYTLLTNETSPDVLQDMGISNRRSVGIGICGVSDFETKDNIFEVKCPAVSGRYNNRWVLQPLMYMCMSETIISTVNVVDFVNGEWRVFPGMEAVPRRVVIKKVLTKFGHRHDHIKRLLGRVVWTTCGGGGPITPESLESETTDP